MPGLHLWTSFRKHLATHEGIEMRAFDDKVIIDVEYADGTAILAKGSEDL